jgi:hypothetical protein
MNEQPDDLLDEAVKLLGTLRRRWDEVTGGTGHEGGPAGPPGDDPGGDTGEDVWSRVVAETEQADRSAAAGTSGTSGEPGATGAPGREQGERRDPWDHGEHPRIATGAPECRDCPICRAIAVSRESGQDVREHLREAGRSLLAAAMDVAAAFERTRGPRGPQAGPARRGPGGAAGDGPIDI